MSKVTLINPSSFVNDASAVALTATNNAALQAAIENTLSRDGTAPNQMLAPLDMNSQRIINLPAPVGALDPVRLQDLSTTGSNFFTQEGEGAVPVLFTTKVGQVLSVKDFGAKCDGVTDDTNAVNAAIARAIALGGGTVHFSGHCVMLGALTIPYTGTTFPKQASIRLVGDTADFHSYLQGGATTGTILDLRYDGTDGLHPAKIDTRGAGILEIANMTIASGGTDNFLICQTTNTTLNFHDVLIRGNAANSGTSCAQDGIQLGGITSASSVLFGILATNGFQGYGTSFKNVYFSHIRHAFNFGGSANGIHFSNIVTDISCGSSETHGAPFYFYGKGLESAGNYFSGGIVELSNYPHAVTMTGDPNHNTFNTFVGMGFYDPVGVTLSTFYCDTSGGYNTFIPSFTPSGLAIVTGAQAHLNTVITGASASTFPLSIAGGSATDSVLTLSGSNLPTPVGDTVTIQNNGSLTARFLKTGISFLRGLSVQNTVAGLAAFGAGGVAAGITIDNGGLGQNYLDGSQTNFRTFAGVPQGSVSSAGFSSPQLTSTVAVGTPPLVVTSTTQVPNLNVALAGNLTAGAMTAYTPTVTSSGGALTSYSVTTASYKTIGKLTFVKMRLALTNTTGASGLLRVSLPVTATSSQSASGLNLNTFKTLGALIGSSSFTTFDAVLYDGTFPAASGDTVFFSFWYE